MNINDIFNQMDYGSTANLMDEARGWIEAHGGLFGPYVLGKWRLDLCDAKPATERPTSNAESWYQIADACSEDENAKLCSVKYGENVEQLIKEEIAARRADDETVERAALQRFGDILAKKTNLAAGLECVSTGRSIGHIINFKLPQAVQRFLHVTNSSSIRSNEPGEVVVIGVPSDASISEVVGQLGPSLTTGNRVILNIYKDVSTGTKNRINLALFFLAEVATEANLPIGSLNVMYDVAPVKNFGQLDSHKIFLDSEQEMNVIGNGFSLISIAKCCYVFAVFDSSDLSAAVEGAVRAIVDYTQEKTSLKIFVQESAFESFMGLLRLALGKLRVGKCSDMSTDIPSQNAYVIESIAQVQNVGYVEMERLAIETFRTAKEVANLINGRGQRQLRLSLWTELIAVALELSDEIIANTIWVNCYREEDPAIECRKCFQDIIRLHQSVKSAVSQRVFITQFEHFQPSDPVIKSVETVDKAQFNWKKISQAERARKLEKLAEPRQNWNDLKELVVDSEIDSLICVLKTSSRYADKISGRIASLTSFRGKVLSTVEPLGAAVIVPSEEFPLLSFSLVAIPLLVAGNSLLIVSSPSRVKLFANLIKILALPAGVITTLESNDGGHPQQTIKSLCHTNIRSIFYFGANDADDVNLSLPPPSSNLKRIQFYSSAHLNAYFEQLKPSACHDSIVLDEMAVGQRKLVWLPSGVTFAT